MNLYGRLLRHMPKPVDVPQTKAIVEDLLRMPHHPVTDGHHDSTPETQDAGLPVDPEGRCGPDSAIGPEQRRVQQFITEALARLPAREPATNRWKWPRCSAWLDWSQRVGVGVTRTQIRTMRNKWGSISTAGILTYPTTS